MRLMYIILITFMSCASTSKVDTQLHEAAVESVKLDIDISIDCKIQTDSEKCQKTILRVKEVLDKGVELTKVKDAVIQVLTTENKTLELKADKWDKLITIVWCFIIGLIVVILCLVLWKYRLTILRLAGVPVPPWMV